MEAAALYASASASARDRNVVCLAHVTNTMATDGEDFEKGVDNGVHDAMALARAVVVALTLDTAQACVPNIRSTSPRQGARSYE